MAENLAPSYAGGYYGDQVDRSGGGYSPLPPTPAPNNIGPDFRGGYYGDQVESSGGGWAPEPPATSTDSVASQIGYRPDEGQTIALMSESTTNDFGHLIYPLELGNTEAETNYVMIYINELTTTTIGSSSFAGAIIDTSRSGQSSKMTGADLEKLKQSVAKGVGSALGKLGGDPNAVGAVTKTMEDMLLGNNQRKRMKYAIGLFMPNDVRAGYQVHYNEASTPNQATGALSQLAAGESWSKVFASSGGDLIANTMRQLAASTGEYTGLSEGFLTNLTGRKMNPRMEQAFESVGFRHFTFNWTFMPKSEDELNNVLAIVNTLKYHMHPEFASTGGAGTTGSAANGNWLALPAEFDIEYHVLDNNNHFLNKINTCVLEGMEVNYTPNSKWSTFRDLDGAPTSINISLAFKELEPLTRNKIMESTKGKFDKMGVYY
jgi:hypothetical protein